LNRRLYGLQARNGCYREEKKPLFLPGIEFRSRCDQSHYVVTVLTELSQLFVTGLRKLGYANQVRIQVPQKNGRNNALTARHRNSTPSGDRLSWFTVLFGVSMLNSRVVYPIARTTVYSYIVFCTFAVPFAAV
jgi:hypothetical protein